MLSALMSNQAKLSLETSRSVDFKQYCDVDNLIFALRHKRQQLREILLVYGGFAMFMTVVLWILYKRTIGRILG